MDDLTRYLLRHYWDLLPDAERAGYWYLSFTGRGNPRILQPGTAQSWPRMIANARIRAARDPHVDRLLRSGDEAFYAHVTMQLAEDDRVVVKRCPQCKAVCRTPMARQCPKCFHSWHRAVS